MSDRKRQNLKIAMLVILAASAVIFLYAALWLYIIAHAKDVP